MYKFTDAYNYYSKLMKSIEAKKQYYTRTGFKVDGSISPKDWEVFSAVLVDDFKSPSHKGTDLYRHEVKTAKRNRKKGTKFEYQYHRNYGLTKIDQDKTVDHIYIIYDKSYDNVEVWLVDKTQMKDTIESFRENVIKAYHMPDVRKEKRCRNTVADFFVKERGKLLLEIEDGKLKTCSPGAQVS